MTLGVQPPVAPDAAREARVKLAAEAAGGGSDTGGDDSDDGAGTGDTKEAAGKEAAGKVYNGACAPPTLVVAA